MEITKENEPDCLYYGFSIKDDVIHCREGYVDAEAELAKLRGPLVDLNHGYYVLEYGFQH